MYAVGRFTTIEQGRRSYTRHNAFSFRASPPFTVTGWNPDVNGEVNSITFVAGHCQDAYLGGNFTKVAGPRPRTSPRSARPGPASCRRNSATTQADRSKRWPPTRRTSWPAATSSRSTALRADPFMASLNDRTGKDDGLLRLHISGHYSYPGAAPNGTRIYNQQLSHSGKP